MEVGHPRPLAPAVLFRSRLHHRDRAETWDADPPKARTAKVRFEEPLLTLSAKGNCPNCRSWQRKVPSPPTGVTAYRTYVGLIS